MNNVSLGLLLGLACAGFLFGILGFALAACVDNRMDDLEERLKALESASRVASYRETIR